MSSPNSGLHLKPADLSSLSFPVKAPTIKLDGVVAGKAGMDDLAARMAAVAASAKEKCVAEVGLITDPLAGMAPGLISGKVESLISEAERLLRKANNLLHDKKYQEGLALVDQALKLEPGNPEGLYLRGVACLKLGDSRKALLAVRPLRGRPMPGKLPARVADLREAARKRMMQPLIDSVMPRLQKDGPNRDAALTELDEAARLDPDADPYHFLLAAGLLDADRPDQARAAIDRWMRESSTAADAGLPELRERVRERQVMKQHVPGPGAVAAASTPRPGPSSAIGPDNRGAPLWVAFDGFLARLGGLLRKKSPVTVDPPGTPAQVDGLYFFLIREELFLAKLMMTVGQFGRGGPHVLSARPTHTPCVSATSTTSSVCASSSGGDGAGDERP